MHNSFDTGMMIVCVCVASTNNSVHVCAHRVLLARPGTGPLFAARHIDAAMSKVRLLDLQETVTVSCVDTGLFVWQ